MNDLYAVMLSWAVTLSGYPAPAAHPEVVNVPHAYLVEHACGGRECKVLGWFPPGSKVFLDKRLNAQDSLLHASIVVHEMTHYLQHQSGKFDQGFSCQQAIALEREAYAVQREFLLRYGVYQPVGASMHAVGCEPTPEQTQQTQQNLLPVAMPAQAGEK
jgi:hypothetical protein